MKKIVFIIVTIVFSGSLTAQITNIPDSNFEQALIDLGIDSDGIINGQVLTADIEGVEVLDVSNRAIINLTGIQDFTALEDLNIRMNNLSNIDLSNNTQLKILDCWGNHFTSINLTENLLLETFIARGNPFSNLDFSENTALKYVNCSYCPLTEINLTNNLELEYLEIKSTSLLTIDLSNNVNLETLMCSVNLFTTLELSNNINLKNLDANVMHALDELDLSNNTLLEYLNIDDTWLGYIDVTANTQLKTFIATFCFLTDIDLSQNINLEYLDISGNGLTSLNTSHNTLLKELYVSNYGGFYGMQMASLDFSNNVNLEIFYGENLLELTHIDAKNDNNEILSIGLPCEIEGYPCQLPFVCIKVDDKEQAQNNQPPYSNWYIAANVLVYTENEDCSLSVPSQNYISVKIYPNPTTNEIFIHNSNQDTLSISLHNVAGRLLMQEEFKDADNQLSLKELSSGTYFLMIETPQGQKEVKKIVKK